MTFMRTLAQRVRTHVNATRTSTSTMRFAYARNTLMRTSARHAHQTRRRGMHSCTHPRSTHTQISVAYMHVHISVTRTRTAV
jgi:hypothetical protein